MDVANNWERELNYYRRECNDLGARLLRLQEEQSQAFREARRSRTVVKLLRETYRLGDFASTTSDVGGATLELVVDNALCDRAALLREDTPGSGRFLLVHAIGLPEVALASVIEVSHPPAFLHTTGQNVASRSAEQIVAAMGVPFVLWSYDRGSGHALAIGNRFESNINRPFEAGDQELIESALSIYLDVLYRKHAEAQLRQAKQAAEAARDARAAFLVRLADEVRDPIDAIVALCESRESAEMFGRSLMTLQNNAAEIVRLARYVQTLIDGATEYENGPTPILVLNPEWTPVETVIRGALRNAYTASIKSAVEIECRLPNRRSAVLVDRSRINLLVQQLVSSAVRATPAGGTVRVVASRRSDGGLEIFFSTRGAGPLAVAHPLPEQSLDAASWSDSVSLQIVRRIVEAHQGSLVIESSAFVGTNVRVMLPAHLTRDMTMSGADED